MSKRKYTTPGSIYKPATVDRLYIKYGKRRVATGLRPTREGYAIAKQMLETMYLTSKGLMPAKNIVSYREAWDEYASSLVNKSPKTIEGYRLSYLAIININEDDYLDVNDIERRVIEYLKYTKHSKVTIHTYLNQFQIFLNYCTCREWIKKTNLKGRYAPKIVKGIALSYSPLECYRIIKYCLKNRPEMGYLIFFMLETGARDVDALTLQWDQVEFTSKHITWKNKITKEDERRPVSDKTIKILYKMKAKKKKKPFSWSYSSSTSLAKYLNKVFVELGIPKNKRSMQEFRVTFRMNLERKGMPEHYIEYLLRHASGKLIYDHYTDFAQFENEIRKYLNTNRSHIGQISY